MRTRKNMLIVIALMVLLYVMPVTALSFSPDIRVEDDKGTRIVWNVIDCPDVPFSWGWQGEGAWLAEPGSTMTYNVTEVNSEVYGTLRLGNFSISANDTDIARELVLGVWGKTPFFPGLVIEIDSESITSLNQTAYEAAARIKGNYLNGTMMSYYDAVKVGSGTYQCIVFDYEQDPTPYGEPQRTQLAYDITSGVLVFANTSYSFGTPYILTLELAQVIPPATPMSFAITAAGIGIVVIVVVVVVLRKMR